MVFRLVRIGDLFRGDLLPVKKIYQKTAGTIQKAVGCHRGHCRGESEHGL